jgi:nitroreductase
MDVQKAISTVLAVRKFQDKAVAPEIVRKILDAGRLTGSAMNRQPWHFILVEDREMLRKLGALATSGPYIAQAAFAIVVATEKTRFSLSDGSRAIQSMILAAWGEGVGSNWVGFQGMEELKPLLGIPEDLDILAILPFGYPVLEIGQGKKNRKTLSEVAHRGRFGNLYP